METATAERFLNTRLKRRASASLKLPDAVMRQAMEETDAILAHPEKYKSYTSVDELFQDLDA